MSPISVSHKSRTTVKSVGLASRSSAFNVTVFPSMVPGSAATTVTLNSIVRLTPVDGHMMVEPPLDSITSAKAAGKQAINAGKTATMGDEPDIVYNAGS